MAGVVVALEPDWRDQLSPGLLRAVLAVAASPERRVPSATAAPPGRTPEGVMARKVVDGKEQWVSVGESD